MSTQLFLVGVGSDYTLDVMVLCADAGYETPLLVDDTTTAGREGFLSAPEIFSSEEFLIRHPPSPTIRFAACPGTPKIREGLFSSFWNLGYLPSNPLVARMSAVAPTVTIGLGTTVDRLVAIASNVTIGTGCQINRASSVGHDVKIEDFVSIGPGVTICGRVQVGRRAFIGAGATILPGVLIGADSVVGSGSVVTKDVASGVVVVGNPATELRTAASGQQDKDCD